MGPEPHVLTGKSGPAVPAHAHGGARVLDQLSAVRAATDAVALLILEDHIRGCLRDAINGDDPNEKVYGLVTVINRYVRGGRR